MRGGTFRITEAVIKAYQFTGREAGYLLKISLMPLGLTLVTSFYIRLVQPEAGVIEQFLWGLPASVAVAWDLDAEARLVLLGERLDKMPQQDINGFGRRRAMRASVIISLLFSMAMTSFTAFAAWAVENNAQGEKAFVSLAMMFMIGAVFWGLRFGVAPILAAIGQPIKKFIFTVNGTEFSLRLVGMMFLCFLPIEFIAYIIGSMLIKDFPFTQAPTDTEIYTMIVIDAVMTITSLTVLNAAAAYAVREILMRGEMKKRL